MPALAKVANAFQIIRTTPAFSGVNGQIDMSGGYSRDGLGSLSAESSLRVAAIYIATTILSDEIASLVLKLVRKDDKNRVPQQPPSLQSFWGDDPNDYLTKFSIDSAETMSLVLNGASYTMLGWVRSGALSERHPIPPANVTLELLDGGGLKLTSPGQGELFNYRGQRPQFSYVPRYVLPGQLTPVSPIRMAAEMAGLSRAYDETAARLAAGGFNPAAVLTFNEEVPLGTAKQYSSELTKLHGGSGKTGGVAVIGGPGPHLEKWGMSMVDAEFVAQNDRIFNLLLAMWRVPATVAGMVDKPSTWGTGIAEFSRSLERFTLRPIVQLRQGAAQKYITRWVDPDLQVKYLFDSLLSASPTDRAEIQRTRLMSGTTSVERVLAQEDEPPFAVGETVYSQLALATDEDRRLERLSRQATTYKALVEAGVEPDAAAEQTGFDPKKLPSIGLPPVTLQAPGGA
jgi:HK97 family phage portal protein